MPRVSVALFSVVAHPRLIHHSDCGLSNRDRLTEADQNCTEMAAAERIRQRYPASDVLAHQHATEQRGLPDATGLVHQSHRMATMAADLCSFFRACGTSTAAIFKSLWRKIVTSTARMTVPRGPRHHHRRSQTGASIGTSPCSAVSNY